MVQQAVRDHQPEPSPQFVYDQIYVLMGNVENSIKELKLELKADRLSCHRSIANSSVCSYITRPTAHCGCAVCLWGTDLATAQVNTLRLKLLKIGARIRWQLQWTQTARDDCLILGTSTLPKQSKGLEYLRFIYDYSKSKTVKSYGVLP